MTRSPEPSLDPLAGRAPSRLESDLACLRQFTSEASRELRGRLAVMRDQVEFRQGRARRVDDDEREALTVLSAEIERLSDLADRMCERVQAGPRERADRG